MRVATEADHTLLIIPRFERAWARWERVRKPIAGSKREFAETCTFARYLAARPDLSRLDWWHTPNEFAAPPKGTDQAWRARRGKQNKDAGVLSGVSDFIIASPFQIGEVLFLGCCIEMKRETGRAGDLSNAQKTFLHRRRAQGWAVGWSRGAYEAQFMFEAIYG